MTATGFPDEPHVDRIAQALWSRQPSGTAVVLVGAGFSRNAVSARAAAGTMPGWNDMYREMVDQLYPAGSPASAATRDWLLGQTGATSAYLRVAEEYEAQYRRDGLDKLILRHVPDQHFTPGDLHRELLQLPWADVMTTNWDTLLERAAEGVEDRVYDVIRTVDEIPEARAPRIVKLHGSLPSHRPFIFTEEDFRTYPVRFAPFVNLAQQLSMENTLVLLGFSGDDPNFLYWSGWVRDRLGPKAPLIYLVGALDLSPSKRRMLESRAVQPIDLAQLPQFEAWPPALRVQNANTWFLERLRAVEPYPARRWPRPPAGFVPPLQFVEARRDPTAPPAEFTFDGDAPVEKLKRLVGHCRSMRLTYPGWVVPPLDVAATVWNRLRLALVETAGALENLPPRERLEALHELDWQLQTSLVPLGLVLADDVATLLSELEPEYATLPKSQADAFRALALSIVRHAREGGDAALFSAWADWLAPRVEHVVEERERLTYERCLNHRSNLDTAELEGAVTGWVVQGDPYWNVRKAGLLADLGREEEANELSIQALNEIRRRTTRGGNDIHSWSRESYAMLLRSTFLYGDVGSWLVHKPVRDRFDQRQDALAARGCAGRQDFFRLIEDLDQVPPPLQSPVERMVRFDLGSSNVKLRFGGIDPQERRLLAYKAIRHLEETGLPARIGNVGVGAQTLDRAATWLIDVDPNRALDALMRGSAKPGSDTFEAVFSRGTIARADQDESDRLVEKLLRLAETARTRIQAPGSARDFWLDRLRMAAELVSRFVIRVPVKAVEAMRLALALMQSPMLLHPVGIPEVIGKLIARSAEAMSDDDLASELPRLFFLPVPPGPNGHHDALDPAAVVPDFAGRVTRTDAWTPAIELALAAAEDAGTRFAATRRLHRMKSAGLLNEEEDRRLGEVLWSPDHLVGGMPGGTIYLPAAFLTLPAPATVDVQAIVTASIASGELIDDAMIEGGLLSVLATSDFPMGEAELCRQIARLREFVEKHAPAPTHPDIVGDRRKDLVEKTSAMFAELARRSDGIKSATEALGELVTSERHPLRIEPAIPALVELGLIVPDEGLRRVRALLSSEENTAPRLIEMMLHSLLKSRALDPGFGQAIWDDVGGVLVGRRPVPLATGLGFLSYAFRTAPDRVPASLDEQATLALELILAETAPERAPEDLPYEPFLVRFRAAVLAGRLKQVGRGGHEVIEAWARAAEGDPLPDLRRAWQIGLQAS